MAEVIEVNDIHELGEYRLAWSLLFSQTPDATFFHTFDWLSIYWQQFGHDQKLRVLVVKAGGQVIGIVPLIVKYERHKLGMVRELSYPLDGWGNFFGPIGGNPAATMALAMKHIARTPRDWDRMVLDWVAHDSSDRRRTYRGMELAGLRPTVEPGYETSIIELPKSWDDYLASRSSKCRHELRRRVRRVGEVDGLRYVRYRPRPLREGEGDPGWNLYDMCQEVAAASWQSELEDGNTLSHPEYREFYDDTHAAAARLGMIDINLFTVHDKPVAFNYNYLCEDRVIGMRMGYHPELAPKGAGLALLAMALEDSCRRGDRSYDLGMGDQRYKQRLRTGHRPTQRLTHTPLVAWRSQAVRLGNWLTKDFRKKEVTKKPA